MRITANIDLKSTSGMGQIALVSANSLDATLQMWDWAGGMGYCDIKLYNTQQTIGDGSTNNQLIIRDQQSAKGLVYAGSYSANFTTYSLVTKEYVDYKVGSVLTTKVSVTSTEILSLFTTPKELITAPGTGKYIELLSAEGSAGSGTLYATYSVLSIIYTGQISARLYNNSLLLRDANPGIEYFQLSPAPSLVILENTAVQLTELSGDPLSGTFDVDIYVTYIIRTL